MDERFKQIKAAGERIKGYANITPVMTSRTLNKMLGAEVYFKCENFQRMGAFKFRGAFNSMSQLTPEQKKNGVVTFSSGNHAQAIALSGAILGVKTTVVMPCIAPINKRKATEEYGADVISYDPKTESREEIAKTLQEKNNLTLIPPFDYENVIYGQGTAAMELIEEVGKLDMLLAPCGGGGLLSGTAIAARNLAPECRVIGVEPDSGDDGKRSFYSKQLQRIDDPQTIADGTRTNSLGKLTFPLILQYVNDFVTVSDESILEAIRFFFSRMRIVVEPSGVLGLSALLSGKVKPRGKIGIILSGGNIDAAIMKMAL